MGNIKSPNQDELCPVHPMRLREITRFAALVASAQPLLAWTMLAKEVRRRMCSDELSFGLQFDLGELPDWEIPLTIRQLEARDIPALLDLRQAGINEREFREMVVRRLCIEAQLQTCYVGTTHEGRPCCMCWLIFAAGNEWVLGRGLPPLQPSEVLLENIWTHPDFRGKRLMMHLTRELFDKAKRAGARRAIAYIREANGSSLAGARAIGWKLFILRRVRHRMFRRHTTFVPASFEAPEADSWLRRT